LRKCVQEQKKKEKMALDEVKPRLNVVCQRAYTLSKMCTGAEEKEKLAPLISHFE